MKVLRTPAERFHGLKGYEFAEHYAMVSDSEGNRVRMHYVDEGPSNATEVVLCLHGEPSWSYLYRHLIPRFSAKKYRVVAPDLVGFGKSDKPASRRDYTYKRHVEWLSSLVFEVLNLSNITLVCQDWGGLLGLRIVSLHPHRFARVVAANTFLPDGAGKPKQAFLDWREFSQTVDPFPTSQIIGMGCVKQLSDEEQSAYDAPYPGESYKEGARAFPPLVPISPTEPEAIENQKAWKVLSKFTKPLLTAFSDSDPITAGAEKVMQARVPGAAGRAHTTITNAGHFLQEDQPEQLASAVISFIESTKSQPSSKL